MNLRANGVASHGWCSSGSNPHRSVSMVGPPGAGTQVHKQPDGISAREPTVTGRSNPRTDSGGLLRELSCLCPVNARLSPHDAGTARAARDID